LTKLSSVCVDNGRIYVGSIDSRLFVFDEITNLGISTVGNGSFYQTFVHVFGLTVKDGLLFVKQKERIIKVFETAQITETSNWDLKPIAALNTLNGLEELYSMDVASGNLIVAGQNTNSYLYYNIAYIRANAAKSLLTPISPTTKVFAKNIPLALAFSADWAITSEIIEYENLVRIYPKNEFLDMKYAPIVNTSDSMGQNPFENVISIAQAENYLFLSDSKSQKIRVLKINKIKIAEQK
jgi:hypothetical protein